ncbi:MAG: MBL fold metallo-hydrolase [bacterium]
MILHTLGSGGWIPTSEFQTLSFAFFYDNEIFIIDAGTGLARLLELKRSLFRDIWPRLECARIFLSHYHYDHLCGLYWTKVLFDRIPLTVYAPGSEIYGKPASSIISDLFKKPFAPRIFSELKPDSTVEDLSEGTFEIKSDNEKIPPLRIGIKLNPNHSDPSVSFRFGDYFAFVTDTPPEEKTIKFVKGVKVLLHESWYDSSHAFEDENDPLENHAEGPHTGSFGAGLIAKRAGIDRLYLIHHNPERSKRDIENDAFKVSAELGIDCRIAEDSEKIEIE